MTAFAIFSPRYSSASSFIFWRIIAEISWGVYSLLPIVTFSLVPILRLIDWIVRFGFVIACRFATLPTSRSPSLVNATTDGVVLPPSALAMIVARPPSMIAIHELVVPRSIPRTFSETILFTPPIL